VLVLLGNIIETFCYDLSISSLFDKIPYCIQQPIDPHDFAWVFALNPSEQIDWFERCENPPRLNHQPIHSDGLERAIRNPIQQEEVVGRVCSGSVCSLPMCMTVVVLFMHKEITVLCDDSITNTFELDNRSDWIIIGFCTTIDNLDFFLLWDDEV
jgi:hypothetical protein